LPQTAPNTRKGAMTGIEIFTYPGPAESPMASWEVWGGGDIGAHGSGDSSTPGSAAVDPAAASGAQAQAAWEARLAEEVRRSFEAGRERGFQEGRSVEREAQAANGCAKEKLRIQETARLAESFHAERSRYFEAVEHEVVRLSLAVAARILRREAQMDPLLLTGAVRVALGQLSASTQVRLRVPPADLELWTDTIAHLPNLAVKPAVLAGEGMRLGDCMMETELGSVDLGVRAQLGEIERGFFDRAGRNPAATAAKSAKVAEDMSE
jgi:flagellar assembly protein FliH